MAWIVQGLVLRDHQDPDWLFRQCDRIARALDDGQIALAQIYGLHIPLDELDDRRLAQLGRIAAFAKAGFNPDEPRVPKGDPHGGEWTNGGGGEGGSASSSTPTPSDLGLDGSIGGGDAQAGSGSSSNPTPLDLGAGDSDSGGGDGSDGEGDNAVLTPEPTADASDAPPQAPPAARPSSSPSGGPSIEYIIVEPQNPDTASGSPPAANNTASTTGIPTPLDSADLDYQIIQPAAIPATTSEPTKPTPASTPERLVNQAPSASDPETPASGLRSLERPPQFPAKRPQTTKEVNAILRSTAVWLGRAATILGPLLSSDPRVRLVWIALDAVVWLAESAPKIVSYLDRPTRI
jgi:hypothetical protein